MSAVSGLCVWGWAIMLKNHEITSNVVVGNTVVVVTMSMPAFPFLPDIIYYWPNFQWRKRKSLTHHTHISNKQKIDGWVAKKGLTWYYVSWLTCTYVVGSGRTYVEMRRRRCSPNVEGGIAFGFFFFYYKTNPISLRWSSLSNSASPSSKYSLLEQARDAQMGERR